MPAIYIPIPVATLDELVRRAKREQRNPRELAADLIARHVGDPDERRPARLRSDELDEPDDREAAR